MVAVERIEKEMKDLKLSNVQSIKELKCMKVNAREEYHAYARQCDERIEEIRNDRGQKLKAPEYSPYYEEGRSRARSNPYALEGGDMGEKENILPWQGIQELWKEQ